MIALVFNAVDIVTGVISALKNKDVKSNKLRDGLFKKVGFIICYFVAWLVDTQGDIIGFHIDVSINPDLLPDKLMQIFHLTNKEE